VKSFAHIGHEDIMPLILKRNLIGFILLALVIVSTGCMTAMGIERRLAPRLSDYQQTEFSAQAQGSSTYNEQSVPGDWSLVTTLSGTKPALLLTSSDYQIAIHAFAKSTQVVMYGICFILPFPVIPGVIMGPSAISYNDMPAVLHGSITSLRGHNIELKEIHVLSGSQQVDIARLWTVRYDETSEKDGQPEAAGDKQQKLIFHAKLPVKSKDIGGLDIYLKIIENDSKEIVFPTIHLYDSSSFIWKVCY
jgi:hypothetical protein